MRKIHGRRHAPRPASKVGGPRKKSTWTSAPGGCASTSATSGRARLSARTKRRTEPELWA
jgi:hypothetical protein